MITKRGLLVLLGYALLGVYSAYWLDEIGAFIWVCLTAFLSASWLRLANLRREEIKLIQEYPKKAKVNEVVEIRNRVECSLPAKAEEQRIKIRSIGLLPLPDVSVEVYDKLKLFVRRIKMKGGYIVAQGNLSFLKSIPHKLKARGLIGKRKGMGGRGEFYDLREYIVGDDYRDIYWKASARMGKLMVKEYEAEKDRRILIVLDTSKEMNEAWGEDVGKAFLYLIFYFSFTRDEFGVLLYPSLAFSGFGRGKGHLYKVLSFLAEPKPSKQLSKLLLKSADVIMITHFMSKALRLKLRGKKRIVLPSFSHYFGIEELDMRAKGVAKRYGKPLMYEGNPLALIRAFELNQ